MTYRIILQRLALQDLHEAYIRAARRAPIAAARWLENFHAALGSLDTNPQRFPLARENSKVAIEIREFLFGKRPNVFRVIYTIDPEAVRVLRIRRAQKRFLSRQQIEDAARLDS